MTATDDVPASGTMTVMLEVMEERRRQITVHGRTFEHDDTHTPQEWGWLVLKRATDLTMPWPEAHLDSRRELIEIAAIALAAVEAMDRVAAATGGGTMSADHDQPGEAHHAVQ